VVTKSKLDEIIDSKKAGRKTGLFVFVRLRMIRNRERERELRTLTIEPRISRRGAATTKATHSNFQEAAVVAEKINGIVKGELCGLR
jgi:hypothetical protein